MNLKKGEKGLSTIVATLIIVLLVLVSTAVIWIVVREVILKGSEKASLDSITLNLDIKNAQMSCDEVYITVKRNVGEGEFIGLYFVMEGEEISDVFKEYVSMEELEVRVFSFLLENLTSDKIKFIKISPIFVTEAGEEFIGDIKDVYTITDEEIGEGGICIINCSISVPVALGAISVTNDSFIANWEAVDLAEGYYIDVARDISFTNFVINNLNVGNFTSYEVTGLNESSIYYYRIRAYGECTSDNSNIIEVSLIISISSSYCWGENNYGQLGIGNKTNFLNGPQLVLGELNFKILNPGKYHTCGVIDNGGVYCWGQNNYGQLGNGSIGETSMPQLVLGELNFKTVTAGSFHTCGITTNGNTYCWGRNDHGELGIGNTTHVYTPQLVLGELNFKTITAGAWRTCGVTTNGSAYCWGDNSYGELGNGSTGGISTTPNLVVGELNFTTIDSGAIHTCGIITNGSAYCWGQNIMGQLGTGDTINRNTPGLVLGGLNFTQIDLGYRFTCGTTINGNAYCWGDGADGRLGNGAYISSYIPIPNLVVGGLDFTTVFCGNKHTCGRITNGSAYCWGYNYYGQVGVPILPAGSYLFNTPLLVMGGLNFTTIDAGDDDYTCGIIEPE